MLDKIISLPKFSETFETFFLERNIFRRTKYFSNLFRPTKNISAV